MTTATRSARWACLLVAVVATPGCVTRQEYLRRDAEMRKVLLDTQARVARVQREVDRLRGDVEIGGRRPGTGGGDLGERLATIEDRLNAIEGKGPAGGPAVIDMGPAEIDGQPPGTSPPPNVAAAPPPTVPPPAPVVPADEWTREVQREQAAVAAMNVAEKGEFVGLLDGVARKDCGRSIDQLNGFVAKKRDSSLADNALYWAARCYLQRGDQNQAISKFYEVGTKYPKGDRTPAALLAQAELFIKMGNTPDARIVLARLTNYYPGTDEANRARQRLSELGR